MIRNMRAVLAAVVSSVALLCASASTSKAESFDLRALLANHQIFLSHFLANPKVTDGWIIDEDGADALIDALSEIKIHYWGLTGDEFSKSLLTNDGGLLRGLFASSKKQILDAVSGNESLLIALMRIQATLAPLKTHQAYETCVGEAYVEILRHKRALLDDVKNSQYVQARNALWVCTAALDLSFADEANLKTMQMVEGMLSEVIERAKFMRSITAPQTVVKAK